MNPTTVTTIKDWAKRQREGQTLAFRRQLFQRWLEGDHFHAGDYCLYFDGMKAKTRKVKPADYNAVRLALIEASRNTVACARCGLTAVRLERPHEMVCCTLTVEEDQ